MRFRPLFILVGASLLAHAEPQSGANLPAYKIVTPDQIQWEPTPSTLPKGGGLYTLSGDLTRPGPYHARAKFPAGYKIASHWFPADQHVTVLSGELAVSDKTETTTTSVPPGSYVSLPSGLIHTLSAKTETIVQISSVGPFDIYYVRPVDDPRARASR